MAKLRCKLYLPQLQNGRSFRDSQLLVNFNGNLRILKTLYTKNKQLKFSLVVEYSASFSNMSVVRRNFLERFIILKLGEFVYKFYSYLEVELVVIFRTDFNWFRSYLYISLLINE